MLYIRQVLVLLIGLYTVRVVLNTLGVEDYGIFNVVGGIVSFFSFLSGSMASATQRFFSFSLGKENGAAELQKIFSINILIYGGIALVALVLLESVGLWFVYHKLNVPPGRFDAALWVFHASCFAFVITILSAPLNAIIIAHEDMRVYAYVSIFEVFLKLGIVYVLLAVPYDKLKVYGCLTLLSVLVVGMIYFIHCFRSYPECRIRRIYYNRALLNNILGFTGWTVFGQVSTVARQEAVTILLNQMFSPVTVAARSIALNICNQVSVFSNSFNTSLYPPIIKSYSRGDKNEMYRFVFKGSKITFLLFWIFALPMFMEMDVLLNLWLKNPPPEAVLFTRLGLIEVLIMSVSLPIATAARAPGKMKTYELVLGGIQFLIFFLDWLALHWGYPAYSIYLVAALVNVLMFLVRLYLVQTLTGLNFGAFVKQVLLPILFVVLLSAGLSYGITGLFPAGIPGAFLSGVVCVGCAFLFMWMVGWNKEERLQFKTFIVSKLPKYRA
ncbi:MAG: hypothetical protein J7599_20020 [Niabella sp.]|nr:hypothetical protein [Niabella sp.]